MNAMKFAAHAARSAAFVLGITLLLSSAAPSARADIPMPAPEVDPGSLSSALTLLIGGALSLTGRIRRSG